MRIERNENYHSYRYWLTPDECKTLKQSERGYRDSLIIQLGGEVGVRSFAIPQIHPKQIKHVDGHARLRVPRGKTPRESVENPTTLSCPGGPRASQFVTRSSRTSITTT